MTLDLALKSINHFVRTLEVTCEILESYVQNDVLHKERRESQANVESVMQLLHLHIDTCHYDVGPMHMSPSGNYYAYCDTWGVLTVHDTVPRITEAIEQCNRLISLVYQIKHKLCKIAVSRGDMLVAYPLYRVGEHIYLSLHIDDYTYSVFVPVKDRYTPFIPDSMIQVLDSSVLHKKLSTASVTDLQAAMAMVENYIGGR